MNTVIDRNAPLDLAQIQVTWEAFDRAAALRPLRTDGDHRHALELVELIWDTVQEDVEHPMGRLLALLAGMISEYEQKRFPVTASKPHEMLAFLLQQGGRTAEELAGIIEPDKLRAVLAGQRAIDAELATGLASVLGVPATLLLTQE